MEGKEEGMHTPKTGRDYCCIDGVSRSVLLLFYCCIFSWNIYRVEIFLETAPFDSYPSQRAKVSLPRLMRMEKRISTQFYNCILKNQPNLSVGRFLVDRFVPLPVSRRAFEKYHCVACSVLLHVSPS